MLNRICLNGMATLVFLAALLHWQPADAAVDTGCGSQVITKADTMVYDHLALRLSKIPSYYHVRMTATVAYDYCPNGRRPDKVKPLFMSWCYSHLDGQWTFRFDGVKGNAYFADAGHSADPPTIKVPNNRTVQNCVTQDLRSYAPWWLRLDYNAGWSATGTYVSVGWMDEKYVFQDEVGNKFKIFNPAADVAISDWH